jgi:Leucine-rich repeat (LRR) protein
MVHGDDSDVSVQFFLNLAKFAGSRVFSRLQLLSAEGWFVQRLFSVGHLPHLIYLRGENCSKYLLDSSIPIKKLRVLYIKGISLERLCQHENEGDLERLWQHENEAPLQLRELYVTGPLSYVPESIGKLKHLEKIDLCGGRFKSLPKEFRHLHSLKHVGLRYCEKMTLLPDSVGNLTGFQSLGNLTGLQSLDLSHSELQTLPDTIGNLIGLQSLSLSHSKLQTLPDSVGNLTGLKVLDLDGPQSA